MVRTVNLGVLAVAIACSAVVAVRAAAPSWENGGRGYDVSDLPSVVVGPAATPIHGQPPLPPEPGTSAPIVSDGEGAVVPAIDQPSITERVGQFLTDGLGPQPPGLLTCDSAMAIEPDGNLVACSDQLSLRDCLRCFQDACWVARVEAIALWRNAPADRPLLTTFAPSTRTPGPVASSANQLQSDPLAAPRLTIARINESGAGFDASYLYAGNFFSERSVPASAGGYAFAPPGIFGNASDPATADLAVDSARQRLVGNLQSAEINLREPLAFGANRLLLGFRWLQWWETWSMTDQVSRPSTPSSILASQSWESACVNNLYGGQLGIDSMLWNSGRGFRLEGLVKGGAYYNAARQQSSGVLSVGAGPATSIAVTGPANCAFVGEVGLTSVVALRKHVDLRCGYFGLWLDGIAQPTRQLGGQTLTTGAPATGGLNTSGGVILQGVSLGLEGRW